MSNLNHLALDRVTLLDVGIASDELGYSPRYVTFRIEGDETTYRWAEYGTDQTMERRLQTSQPGQFGLPVHVEIEGDLADLLGVEDDEEFSLREAFDDWCAQAVSDFDGRLDNAADEIAASVVADCNEFRSYTDEA